MKEYTVKSTDSKNFWLTDDDKQLGHLKYQNWFSLKAEIILADHEDFKLEPKGFWSTTIELKNKGTVVAKIKMRWSGDIIVSTKFDNTTHHYTFNHRGFLKSSYVLLDHEGKNILNIEPDFKWRNFTYDYTLTVNESFEKVEFKDLLLLTSIHCANYYMNTVVVA